MKSKAKILITLIIFILLLILAMLISNATIINGYFRRFNYRFRFCMDG